MPRADQHQNEYVPPSEERLAWLTGFTGSAGLALVLADRAMLFVDGRYTLQAAQQVDTASWTVAPLAEPSPETWIAANFPKGGKLGFDPWLHTNAAAEKLASGLRAGGRRTCRGRDQPARCGLDRASGTAARRRERA